MPYYVVKHGKGPDTINPSSAFHSSHKANEWADARHKETGNHYYVLKVDTVYTTKTLAEVMAE